MTYSSKFISENCWGLIGWIIFWKILRLPSEKETCACNDVNYIKENLSGQRSHF